MSRTVAILGGGDWSDASIKHIEIPDDMDLDKMRDEYCAWYRGVYLLGSRPVQYLSLADWLVSNRSVKWADVEEYHDL